MRKIRESKLIGTLVFTLMAAIVGIILRPVLDWLMCKYIFHTKFYYAEWKHIVQPVVVAIFVGVVVYLPFFSSRKVNLEENTKKSKSKNK